MSSIPQRNSDTFAHWIRSVALTAASRTTAMSSGGNAATTLTVAKKYEEYLRTGRLPGHG